MSADDNIEYTPFSQLNLTGNFKNLSGRRFGRLLVVECLGRRLNYSGFLYQCTCDCGNITNVISQVLRSGYVRSCGCLANETKRRKDNKYIKHGKTRTPAFYSWASMKERCLQKNYKEFHNYGGRGITICERWLESFNNFFEDMGERPPGTTLDRIDNNGNYEPSNCRWATNSQQHRNTRSNVWIEYNGERKLLIDWSNEKKLSQSVIQKRIKAGWSVEKALNTRSRKWRHLI